jgi:hypothetical protein
MSFQPQGQVMGDRGADDAAADDDDAHERGRGFARSVSCRGLAAATAHGRLRAALDRPAGGSSLRERARRTPANLGVSS